MAYYIDENKKTAVKYEGKNAFTWNVSTRKFDLPMPDVSPKSRMRRCSEFDARCYLFENDPVDYVGMVVVLKRIWHEFPEREPDMNQNVEQAEAFFHECAVQRAQFEPYLTNYRNGIQAYAMGASGHGKFLESIDRFLYRDELIARLALQIAKSGERIAQCEAEMEKCESGHCEECKWYPSCGKHPNPVNPEKPTTSQ